jgi:hypothetical protein
MRRLNSHQINECNQAITVLVTDEPGAGGANHNYVVVGPSFVQTIQFQNGPIQEVGVNGTTQEVLLAILRDRLVSFQNGPYACDENDKALEAINVAIEALHSRTRARVDRGVEGTHTI